jgi:hypothetical protein
MLRLPDEMRNELAKPHGRLYKGRGEEVFRRISEAKECRVLACVGDLVSLFALRAELNPDIIVIDGKTIRKEIEDSKEIESLAKDYTKLEAENPAGFISCDLVKILKKAVETVMLGEKVKVFVIGEEDLAVMPLGLIMPNDSLILYGQPGEGVVALKINDEKKVLIQDIMKRMEKVESCEEIEKLLGGD